MAVAPKPYGQRLTATIRRTLGVIAIFALYIGAVRGYQWALHNTHWFHHKKLMFVYAENWANGEYKSCLTLNVDLEEPSLTCDSNENGKTFKVQFNGETYDKEKTNTTTVQWRCRKYRDSEATIDCEYISEVQNPPRRSQ
jgi:hypothetical protein